MRPLHTWISLLLSFVYFFRNGSIFVRRWVVCFVFGALNGSLSSVTRSIWAASILQNKAHSWPLYLERADGVYTISCRGNVKARVARGVEAEAVFSS